MGGNRQGMGRNQGRNSGMGQGMMHGGMGQGMMQGGMGQGRGPGNRQGPPEEAFTACEGKSHGDECSVETPRGKLSGLCMSRGNQIFCVPEGTVPEECAADRCSK